MARGPRFRLELRFVASLVVGQGGTHTISQINYWLKCLLVSFLLPSHTNRALMSRGVDAEDVGGCGVHIPFPTLECTHGSPSAMERQVSEGSVTSTDDSLFSKLSGAAGAGGLITDPGESTKVLTRSGHSKGDSVETLPAFLFSQSSDHACELKHLHRDHALLTDKGSRLSSFRRPRFSTLYARFAAFP